MAELQINGKFVKKVELENWSEEAAVAALRKLRKGRSRVGEKSGAVEGQADREFCNLKF